MFHTVVGAVFVLGVVKLVLAVCGYRVTWRLAFLIAVLIALFL